MHLTTLCSPSGMPSIWLMGQQGAAGQAQCFGVCMCVDQSSIWKVKSSSSSSCKVVLRTLPCRTRPVELCKCGAVITVRLLLWCVLSLGRYGWNWTPLKLGSRTRLQVDNGRARCWIGLRGVYSAERCAAEGKVIWGDSQPNWWLRIIIISSVLRAESDQSEKSFSCSLQTKTAQLKNKLYIQLFFMCWQESLNQVQGPELFKIKIP